MSDLRRILVLDNAWACGGGHIRDSPVFSSGRVYRRGTAHASAHSNHDRTEVPEGLGDLLCISWRRRGGLTIHALKLVARTITTLGSLLGRFLVERYADPDTELNSIGCDRNLAVHHSAWNAELAQKSEEETTGAVLT